MRLPLTLVALVSLVPAAAACDGLSPGDQIVSGGASCTLAFLVANADGLWFSTAGHCVADGAAVSNPDHGEIGVAAFRHLDPDTGSVTDGAPGEDFALIRIDPKLYDKLNPKMCGWDGPTGLVTDGSADGGGVRHYGHGLVFGDGGPTTQQRQGILAFNDDNYAFYWTGAGVPGDSGSAVIAEDGRALGVLTHLQISPDTNGGTHLLRGFQLAQDAGFKPLRLVLAGESPTQVLAQLRASPPTGGSGSGEPEPATPTPPTAGNATAPPANGGGGELGNATAPTPPADDAGENVTPGDADGGSLSGATSDDEKQAPGAPLALVLLALAGLAARRRR